MYAMRICFIHLCLVLAAARAVDRYTDGNRPYEFGFTIEGEQHRQEKKDENGLIMGEFGFITADGIYHVTAYATDENGNFKILSSKNLRVRPSPFEQNRQAQPAPTTQQAIPQEPVSIQQPSISCSHCSIPSISTVPAQPDYAAVQQNYEQNPGVQSGFGDQALNVLEEQGQAGFVEQPQDGFQGQQQNDIQGQPDHNDFNLNTYNPQQQFVSQAEANAQYDPNQQHQYSPEQNPQTPQLISAQIQLVDPNTDINKLNPGENPGLPNGVTNQDLEAVFYTFNYTVGFHGHHEEGYVSGAKKGYYYITGRNGVRTRVDYEADENGFRPKITEEVLDLISEQVPKPETEKDEKYGLKGYEFKWLYYPVEKKQFN